MYADAGQERAATAGFQTACTTLTSMAYAPTHPLAHVQVITNLGTYLNKNE